MVVVRKADVASLTAAAGETSRHRMRLCAHRDVLDRVHEMLIVHERGAYVRPHKHIAKSESFHVIDGRAEVVIFSDAGVPTEVISIGDYASGQTFFYRIDLPLFHSVLIRSEVLVFHETTRGPFDRAETVFADWAPDEGDPVAVAAFLR